MNSYRWVLIEEAKELSASPDLHLLRQRVLTISVFILLIFILLTPCTVFVPLCRGHFILCSLIFFLSSLMGSSDPFRGLQSSGREQLT